MPYCITSDQALELLLQDGDVIIFRGILDSDNVLFVIPASDQLSRDCFTRFSHEYGLKDLLETSWAARPLKLEQAQGRDLLLLEDPGGEFLETVLGRPMEAGLFLRVALSLVKAVIKLHERGLIHKDIKPAHILVDMMRGAAWLTGFGIATRSPREHPALDRPEIIAGTLPYMAPEQTGRMNRSIDTRSDLYSLGATFYRMLTGCLPFTASDPLEWVHCHIARKTLPPSKRVAGIPAPVSAIVMKLLAKPAEERYQTAAGLDSDLQRCLAEWDAHGRIHDFQLGGHDIPDRLLIPEKLYGRAREIDTLLSSFERVVASGTAELVLVSGYSGIGKSSVVNELHKALVPPRGLFASGKFDQYKRDIPYSTLAQAFERLIRQLLGKSETELRCWREAFQEALGANGQLMVDLVPELKLIIGAQPPVPELEPQQAQSRFQLVFRRFIGVFARPEHPLALFLDDLQWLDAATLDLIEDLLTHPDVQHLLLIGAYRSNEVNPAHPLMRKLDEIRHSGAIVQQIALAPLAPEDVTEMITDSTHCDPERGGSLGQLVHAKTDGNPFFVIQFLSALAEEGLLAFDHSKGQWSWDLDCINAKGFTDNVADLMAGKLLRLPTQTQRALQQFACLGSIAETATLCLVLEKTEDEVHTDLREAVCQELVRRLTSSYRFVHDRVREAAYSLIPEEKSAEVHLRIGRILAAQTSPEKREEAVFEIVSQLNRGSALITSREEREELAALNLMAGKRSKASTAYASAVRYLTAGAAHLAEDCWERQHDLAFSLEINRAECEFLTGELGAAEERLAALSKSAADTMELAAVTSLRMDLYTTLDQSNSAILVGLDCLRHLGVDWQPQPTEEEVRNEYKRIWSQLANRTIEDLIDLPIMSDLVSLATLEVLTKLRPAAFLIDANLAFLVICKAVNLSLEHGNSDASSVAYVWLGMIAGPRFGDYEAGFRFGQLGYDLVQQRGLKRFKAKTYLSFGVFIVPWTKHIREGRDLVRQAFDSANAAGDLTYAGYSCYNKIANMLAAGDSLIEVQRETSDGLEFAQKARFGLVLDIMSSQLGLIKSLRGLTRKFGTFNDDQFDELRFERHLSSKPGLMIAGCWHWIRKMQARFFAGDYSSAIEAWEKAHRLLWMSPAYVEVAECHFYGALSRAARYDAAAASERCQDLEELGLHQRQLEIWAKNCPENFENRAALVAAEIARIEGRVLEAEHLYERAIQSAGQNGFVHHVALAHELAGRFYLNRGLETNGLAHLSRARACFGLWGADGKVKQLDREYPRMASYQANLGAAGNPPAAQNLDTSTMLKASQAVSGEIELPRLIETLMTIALQSAGADRGLLIVPCGEEYYVEAEALVNGDKPEITLHRSVIADARCSPAIVNTVVRTGKCVILDDASRIGGVWQDAYLRRALPCSVLCLPLLRQAKLSGVLYLENSHATGAFTPDRIAVLELLCAQAAISLENARLYADLSTREARIRRLVDSNIVGIVIWTLDGRIVEANDAYLAIIGYDRDDLVSERLRWTETTPAEWDNATRDAIEQLKAKGAFHPYEKEYFRKDGSRIPVLIGGALFEGSQHEGVSFVLDLSEKKEAELRQTLLIEELNHRVKNTLATVLALSAQTFRLTDTPEAFHKAFEGRLLALSRTHNLLNRSCWTGVSLRDILEQELAPYSTEHKSRFVLSGDDVRLGPVASVTLGIAFHELATNAAKYGALSVPCGQVRVSWQPVAPDRLQLEWTEAGGPPVLRPLRNGFGSRLIEEMLPGEVRLEFQPHGVRCTMDIALT